MSEVRTKRAARLPTTENDAVGEAVAAVEAATAAALPPAEPATEDLPQPITNPEPVPAAPAIPVPTAASVESVPEGYTGDQLFAFGHDALGAIAESQAALARGFEAVTAELGGIARDGIAAAAASATAMLGVRTWADAFEVQAGFARRSVDAAIDGSAKLSEIGVKAASDAFRPILARLGEPWKPARPG